MSTKIDSEQQLIADCRRNKASAQRQIYERYAPAMLGICVRYVGNRETARDVLQDGFIKLFTKIDDYAGGSFQAWVRAIFVTTALETLRKQDVLRYTVDIDDYHEILEDEDNSIIDQMSGKDLMDYIAKLPDNCRTVFNMYAIEGYSHAEIANILHIKEVTVRSQFCRARKFLKEKIEKHHIKKEYA